MSHNSEYCQKQMEKLIDGTITCVIKDPYGYFGLRVEKGGVRYNLWIQSDSEGNDVGWVSVDKVHEPEEEEEEGPSD